MASFEGLNWTAFQLATGNVICHLPGIELMTGALTVTIGQVETAQVALNVTPRTAPEWYSATQPGGAGLIAWTGDPDGPTIIYGGLVQQRSRSNYSRVLLTLATGEDYLRGCYVGSFSQQAVNQDTIVAALMAFANGTNQLPWTLNHVPIASTQLQTISYTGLSAVTVLRGLQELSALSGGPEWTVTWNWNQAASTITPVFNYGQRIGTPAPNGVPAVTIRSTDLQDGAAFVEDYSEGMGANQVTVYSGNNSTTASTGVGPSATAPASITPAWLNGRPLWQFQYQPNTTTTDATALAAYAAAAANQLQNGAQPLSLTLPRRRGKKQFGSGYGSPGKQFGTDWNLGDDIGYELTGPVFPVPVSGIARVVGYQVAHESITPVLQGAKL